MPKRKMTDEQWLDAVQECRSSGLSDKDWCALHQMHPSTLYKAIRRLRIGACTVPDHSPNPVVSLPQEVVEIASVDENGSLIPSRESKDYQDTPVISAPPAKGINVQKTTFQPSIRITTTSGIQIEMTNNATAAAIRNIICALQTL